MHVYLVAGLVGFIMNKKLMNKFSEWLKRKRKESGLTLMQLKSAIGDLVSDAYLSKLENDKYKGKKGLPPRPDKELVIALAEVFRDDVDYVLTLAGYPVEKNAESFEIINGARVSFEHEKFTKEQKEQLLNAMRLIAAGVLAQDELSQKDKN